MHAALGVDLVERRIEAGLHAEAERRGRPFQHGGLAEHDGVGGDAVLGERRNGKHRRAERDGCGEAAARRKVHEVLPGLGRWFAASGRCEASVKECLTIGEMAAAGLLANRACRGGFAPAPCRLAGGTLPTDAPFRNLPVSTTSRTSSKRACRAALPTAARPRSPRRGACWRRSGACSSATASSRSRRR